MCQSHDYNTADTGDRLSRATVPVHWTWTTHKRCAENHCNYSWNTKHQINQLTNCHTCQCRRGYHLPYPTPRRAFAPPSPIQNPVYAHGPSLYCPPGNAKFTAGTSHYPNSDVSRPSNLWGMVPEFLTQCYKFGYYDCVKIRWRSATSGIRRWERKKEMNDISKS